MSLHLFPISFANSDAPRAPSITDKSWMQFYTITLLAFSAHIPALIVNGSSVHALHWLKNILPLTSSLPHILQDYKFDISPNQGVTLASGWWKCSMNPVILLSDPTFTFHSSCTDITASVCTITESPRVGSQFKMMLWPKSYITLWRYFKSV